MIRKNRWMLFVFILFLFKLDKSNHEGIFFQKFSAIRMDRSVKSENVPVKQVSVVLFISTAIS